MRLLDLSAMSPGAGCNFRLLTIFSNSFVVAPDAQQVVPVSDVVHESAYSPRKADMGQVDVPFAASMGAASGTSGRPRISVDPPNAKHLVAGAPRLHCVKEHSSLVTTHPQRKAQDAPAESHRVLHWLRCGVSPICRWT